VVDKIELDLQRPRIRVNQRRGNAARRHFECHVPGMVQPWRQRKPRLADNLRPQLQRRARVLPRGIGKFGPLLGHDWISSVVWIRIASWTGPQMQRAIFPICNKLN